MQNYDVLLLYEMDWSGDADLRCFTVIQKMDWSGDADLRCCFTVLQNGLEL